MQIFFDNAKNPVVVTKSWKIGLEDAAENLLKYTAGAIVAYVGNILANTHPSTVLGGAEVIIAGTIFAWLLKWLEAHKLISQAQATTPPVTIPKG